MSTRLLSSQYGGYKAQYGVAMYGGRNAELAQLVLFRPERYKLRMYNRTTQAFVAELPDWSAINRNLQLNRAEVMSFSYPLDTPRLVTAIKATTNRVLLTDNKGQTIEKYNVRDFEENSDDNTITVNCYSLMGQWAHDRGVNYSATSERADDSLTAIFSLKQVNQDLWGGIYLDYGQSDSTLLDTVQDLDYKDKSILQIVEDFRNRQGGIIFVDPEVERLVWRTNVRQSSSVKEIRFNKNMGTLRLKESPDSVRNRIIVKGKDAHNREISVTVNDVTSQAEYGIRVKNVPGGGAGRFATIAELTDFGNELLIKLKDPAKKTDINSIDLSQADTSVDFSFDDIGLGQLVRLLHPDFSIATSDHMVIGIKQELSKSANIILQLGRPGELNESRTPDFIEMVAETFNKLQEVKENERDQYPTTLSIDDMDDVDDLLGTEDHPSESWADGEWVIEGSAIPYTARVRKAGASGITLPDWVELSEMGAAQWIPFTP